MSDGLYPPLNAPPAGAAVPGVQPGTTGQFFGFIVIVYGPAGTPSGVFVYQPGTTPALGNPPIAGMTASTTDLFGNPIPGGGNGELFIQAPGGTGQYVLISSLFQTVTGLFLGTRRPAENPVNGTAGIFEDIINQGAANEQLTLEIGGPETTIDESFAEIFLFSAAANGTIRAFGLLTWGDDAVSSNITIAEWNNLGISLPFVNQIVGQQPGATVPTADTFHTMAPLASGFNTTGNNFNGDPTYAEYTFEPMGPKGSVHIRVNANVTAGPGAAFKLLTGTALLPGYRPTQPRYFEVSFNEAAVIAGSNNAMGMGVLETSGNIFVYGGAGVAADSCLVFETTIRLD